MLKAYVITSGIIFALITLAHIARVVAEGTYLLREPSFIATTTLAIALGVWAFRALKRLPAGQDKP